MNLNPIDFNYIDGENIYPIQEYIDEQIYEKIEYNNVSNTHSSNIRLNNNQKLDKSLYYNSSNLYIWNSNDFGEIRFKTSYNYPIDSNKVGTIIDYTGKLQVYHNYNIFQPTFGAGYYDVEQELLSLKADGINTDAQLTLLEAGAVYLQSEIDDILFTNGALVDDINTLINVNDLNTMEQFQYIGNATDFQVVAQSYNNSVSAIGSFATTKYNTAFVVGGLTSLGIGLAGAGISAVSSYIYYQNASNTLYHNSNFTDTEKGEIFNCNLNISNEVKSYSNFDYSISNLNIFNGFINCNIITTQYINSINTNELKLNNLNISNIFVSSNVASNTSYGFSNDIFSSSNLNFNYTSNSSNINFNYTSNLSFNSSNYIINNYGSNIRVKLPNTQFTYDPYNNIYIYDLDISQYVPYKLIQRSPTLFLKTRIFKITSFMSVDFINLQFTNLNNLTGNAICYPETLTIYMSNLKNNNGIQTADDTYSNTYIYGKQNPNLFAGYWNAVGNNFNYIRFITGIGFDMDIIIETLLF